MFQISYLGRYCIACSQSNVTYTAQRPLMALVMHGLTSCICRIILSAEILNIA